MVRKYKGFIQLKRLEFDVFKKDGTLSKVKAIKYCCEDCKELFPISQIDVDHIIPVGSLKSIEEVGEWAKRLFSDYSQWQVLCTHCHRMKTNSDNEYRNWQF